MLKQRFNTLAQQAVITLLLVSSPFIHAEKPIDSESLKTVQAIPTSAIDEIVSQSQKQLDQLAIACTTISHIVHDGSLQQVQKDKALAHIKSLIQIIQQLRNEKFVEVDLPQTHLLLQLNQALTEHVLKLIATQCSDETLFSFSIEDVIKKTAPTKNGLSFEFLVKSLIINDSKVAKLTESIKTFGLSRFNKFARFVGDYIVDPAQRYKVPQRLFGIGAISSMLIYSAAKVAPEILKANMSTYWYETFLEEEKTILQDNGKTPLIVGKNGYIPKIDFMIGRLKNNWLPIGLWLNTAAIASLSDEWKAIKPWIIKKATIFWNKAKGGSYLKEAQKAAEIKDKVRFKDIYGQKEIIAYWQLIVDYLENPETCDRLGITPAKGILCVGDTRTGKTYSINALFGEIQDMLKRNGRSEHYKIHNLHASIINSIGIKVILDEIKRSKQPCILFIDEIDLLDLQRTGKNEALSEFLTSMSGVLESKDSKNQVIIIAATNRPETLDIALRQPGRFGKELRYEYPNLTDRTGFIKHRIEKLSLDTEQFDVDKLARYTENKSYEALTMLLNSALLKSRIRNTILTQELLEETLNTDIRHIAPISKAIPQHERKILSAYFAGQALALVKLNPDNKLSSVTINQVMTDLKEEAMGTHLFNKEKTEQQRFEYGKIFMNNSGDTINMQSRDEKLKLCQVYCAGFAAEDILRGSCGYSCHPEDAQTALSLALSIVFTGYDKEKLPKHIQKQKYDEAIAIVDECKKQVTTLLKDNPELLQQIADLLEERSMLDVRDITALL